MNYKPLFNYKYAVVCRSIPNSIKNGLSMYDHDDVNVELAIKEHDIYLKALRDCNLELIEIEGDEEYPDCVFVEDIAVAIGDKIFITNPGALTRRGEVKAVKSLIQKFINEKNNKKFEIEEIKDKNEAFLEGGDVCFTGREILVGISSRTNHKGVEELAKFFEGIPVTKINVNGTLHLKSVITLAFTDTFIVSKSSIGQTIKSQIEKKSHFIKDYKFIGIEENNAANVLFLNGKMFYPSDYEHFYKNISEFNNIEKYSLPNKEFEK